MSALRQKIEQEIHTHGPIPFSRYMELCLYDPELGYYSRHAEQFGKAGDFYTSSDVHAVFGRLLARQFNGVDSLCPCRTVHDRKALGLAEPAVGGVILCKCHLGDRRVGIDVRKPAATMVNDSLLCH